MSTEQNKAIVRRFVEEVLAGGNVELVDELLSPDYVNRGMGGMGRADFKAWLGANSAGPGGRMDIVDLVARAMPWSPASTTRSRSRTVIRSALAA